MEGLKLFDIEGGPPLKEWGRPEAPLLEALLPPAALLLPPDFFVPFDFPFFFVGMSIFFGLNFLPFLSIIIEARVGERSTTRQRGIRTVLLDGK